MAISYSPLRAIQCEPKHQNIAYKPQIFVHIFGNIYTYFHNLLTGTFCRKFVIKRLLIKSPAHLNCVATLPCEIRSTLQNNFPENVPLKKN